MSKRVLPRFSCCNGRQETLIALEWALFAVFAVDLLLKVYLREARIAYLTSFDGVARLASVLPIVQLRGQAPLGFLRALRVYQLAKMVSCVFKFYGCGVRVGTQYPFVFCVQPSTWRILVRPVTAIPGAKSIGCGRQERSEPHLGEGGGAADCRHHRHLAHVHVCVRGGCVHNRSECYCTSVLCDGVSHRSAPGQI